MNFTCNAKDLSIVLKNAIKAKSYASILECAYIDADMTRNTIRVLSTDLDTSIRIEIPATIHENGSMAIPIKETTELLSNLSKMNGDIQIATISGEKNVVSVTSGTSTFSLECKKADDFPVSPIGDDYEYLFTIPSKQIEIIAKTVGLMVAKDDSQEILKKINILSDDGNISFAATDGEHIQIATVKPQNVIDKDFSISVRPSALKLIKNLNSNNIHRLNDSNIHCWLRIPVEEKKANIVYFSTDDGNVISTSIPDGNYPAYRSFLVDYMIPNIIYSTSIPDGNCPAYRSFLVDYMIPNIIYQIVVNPKDLLSLCCGDDKYSLTFHAEEGSNQLTVSSDNGEMTLLGDTACKSSFSAAFRKDSIKKIAKSLDISRVTSATLLFAAKKTSVIFIVIKIVEDVKNYYLVVEK
ncbi:MAG: hypothetical protein QME49_08105 [bacterium]|nr:hypothetical protein [bacterium]